MLSSISNTGAGFDSSSITQPRSQAVDQIFKKVDSNRDDKITKSELTQALESDSVEIGSSDQEPNVGEIFKLLDAGNKGYITKQDAADGLDKLSQTPSGGATSEAGGSSRGGSRPAGGGGGGGGAIASEDYDPADTNQDGTVSMQEEIAYILEQYTKTDSTQQSESVIRIARGTLRTRGAVPGALSLGPPY